MQNSNVEAASGWPETLKDLTNDPYPSDDLQMVSLLAFQYSSTKNYVQLNAFMEQLQLKYGKTSFWQNVFLTDEQFVLALIDSKMHRKEFGEVYRLIEVMGSFSKAENLVAIWNDAHYKEEEIKVGRHLTPVMKYRIRAKFPPPLTLHPPGQRFSLRLPRSSANILQRWSADHTSQMPTSENIESLALEANLTCDQVKNWFRRSVAKYKKEQAEKQNCARNPLTKLNLCLPSAVDDSENQLPRKKVTESPTKYLNKVPVPPRPLSDAKSETIKVSEALVFQKEDFLGYVPAYCICNSGSGPNYNHTVIFDARCIINKIPSDRNSAFTYTDSSINQKMDVKAITGIPSDVKTPGSQ